jgi:hypothetical protein
MFYDDQVSAGAPLADTSNEAAPEAAAGTSLSEAAARLDDSPVSNIPKVNDRQRTAEASESEARADHGIAQEANEDVSREDIVSLVVERPGMYLEDFVVGLHPEVAERAESNQEAAVSLEDCGLDGAVSFADPMQTSDAPIEERAHLPDRLAGLLGEAEALLRESAITAAMAAAAAEETEPSLNGLLAVASAAPVAFHVDPLEASGTLIGAAISSIGDGNLHSADALLDAVDGFLGAATDKLAAQRSAAGTASSAEPLGTDAFASPSTTGVRVIDGVATPAQGYQQAPVLPEPAPLSGAAPDVWVSDARHWDGGDLSAKLEEICAELDDVVGFSTARGRELEQMHPGAAGNAFVMWPLPDPLAT